MLQDREGGSESVPARRTIRLDIRKCIDRACEGEVYELEWYEHVNWVTAVFRCALCGREFTVKVEA